MLIQALKKTPIIYVTRDLERAMGRPLSTPGYFVITNDSPFARPIARRNKNILLIKAKEKLDTRELLEHPEGVRFIEEFQSRPLPLPSPLRRRGGDSSPPFPPRRDPAGPAVAQRRGREGRSRNNHVQILVFKNTPQIEKICAAPGWHLLNPSAELANRVEEKISQLKWLGPLKKYLPPHQILLCRNVSFPSPYEGEGGVRSRKFILQFNRAHTGIGTILIESEEQLKELQQKFPNREVRVTEFIEGPVFTSNNVVGGNKVLIGNISYQITGRPPFTDQPFATIGNDWALARKLLSNKQSKQIKQIATNVGKKLAKDGWKGLFGIDVIMEEKTGKLYLLEINARQPASTTYESQLQARNTYHVTRNKKSITTFEAHLAALFGLRDTGYVIREIAEGAQIIQRVTSSTRNLKSKILNLKSAGFTIIPYTNIHPGEDLWRIQSKKGIMKDRNTFNKIGKQIASIIAKISS